MTNTERVDFFNEIVRVLTDYEHPQDSQLTEMEAANQLYDTLVKVQNAINGFELLFNVED